MPRWPNGSQTMPQISQLGAYGPRAPIDTNGDGRPDTSSVHSGTDFIGFVDVYSAVEGTLIYAQFNSDGGNEVRIRHDDGHVGRYYHLKSFAAGLPSKTGQRLPEGTYLGPKGATGNAKGEHLHFRIDKPGGGHIDPLTYMRSIMGKPGTGGLDLDTVAKQVIAGKWGNGNTRIANLTAAGYNAGAVQARVNQILAGNTTPTPSKDVDTLATEVLNGQWGNGADRISRLTSAGYDAAAVQARVNERLAASKPKTRKYTVQKGDNLSAIATAHGVSGGWRALYNANRGVIGHNPNLIRVGQVLTIP